MMNGIYEVEANSIKHWVKAEGAEQGTSPLVISGGNRTYDMSSSF